MHRRTVLELLLGATLVISGTSTATAKETLKWGHTYEVDSIYHEAALRTANMFGEATKGKYEIVIFPASQLGSEAALNESLSIGTVDMIYSGPTFMSQSYGPIVVSAYPFALRDYDHWKAYSTSDLFAELSRGYEEATGNHVASLTYFGSRNVTANKPILTPADMKDLKIRTPNTPAYQWFPLALGANAVPINFSEVYLALQQGVVDAEENPLPVIKSKRFYEVQSHINLTSHIVNSLATLVSQNTIDRLGDDYPKLEALLQENALWGSDRIRASEKELVDWFRKQGITVSEVDREPFIAAARKYLTTKKFPFSVEIYERLQAIGN